MEIIEAANMMSQQPRGSYFRPSMLHGCDRANVFHYINAPYKPPPQNPKMQRTLDMGTALHDLIQGYLMHSYDYFFVKEARSRLSINGVVVQGSTDGVLIDRVTNKRYCVEIKTMEGDAYRAVGKAKAEHVDQAMNYAVANDCEGIIFLYWDKNRSLVKQYYVPIGEAQAKRVRRDNAKRVLKLKAYADKYDETLDPETLPPYNKSTCNKSFCGYIRYCRKMGAPV